MINKRLMRIIVIYIILLPVSWFLIEAVWGGLHGVLIARNFMSHDVQAKITKLMKERGIPGPKSKADKMNWYENLPKEDKIAYEKLIFQEMDFSKVASFGSTFAVCFIVFGIIGLLVGFFTHEWMYVGIVPLVSFLVNNPIIRFLIIKDMSIIQKVAIILLAQFGVSYLTAYFGMKLAYQISKKKQIVSTPSLK